MARDGLVKLDAMVRWNDSVFGTFTSNAPRADLVAAMEKVEQAYGDISNLVKVLEAAEFTIVIS